MSEQQQQSPPRKRPHILLLVTDQFRYDALGPRTTPHLYRLATHARATNFGNAYSSTPTCTPARAGLLTGKSPWNHGMLGYAGAVDCQAYPTTLPGFLSEQVGYRSIAVGKNHFGYQWVDQHQRRVFVQHGYQHMELYDGLTAIPDDYQTYFRERKPGVDPLATCGLGWNDWRACPYAFAEDLHPTAWTTREALQAIDETLGNNNNIHSDTEKDAPLLLKVSYHRPHSPYDPPQRLWRKHQRHSQHRPKDYDRNVGSVTDPSCWDAAFYQNFTADPASMPPETWQGDPGDEPARATRAAYLANVEFVDEGVGLILDKLEELGQLDDTFVVWVSDHGDMLGDHNLWRKGYPWEASAHVNMVMKLPASFPQSRQDEDVPAQSERRSLEQDPVPSSFGTKQVPKTTNDNHANTKTSHAVVELRDVAPTIYDLLGILPQVQEQDPTLNGKSLLPILQGRSTQVRTHLDLEHNTVYDDRIHWNALVGQLPPNEEDDNADANEQLHSDSQCPLYKYIFLAQTGTEQLFCLTEDPLERTNLATDPSQAPIVSAWRALLVEQFVREGRGSHWVTPDGHLQRRTTGTNIGPNYPCSRRRLADPEYRLPETGALLPEGSWTNAVAQGTPIHRVAVAAGVLLLLLHVAKTKFQFSRPHNVKVAVSSI